jgi:hypothetical protein
MRRIDAILRYDDQHVHQRVSSANPSTCPTNNPVCIALDNGGTTCVQCDGTNDAYWWR